MAAFKARDELLSNETVSNSLEITVKLNIGLHDNEVASSTRFVIGYMRL